MLFNLYLTEIPSLLDREDTDPIILPIGFHLTSNCLLYTHDLVLISHSSILSEYFDNWLLSVNPRKTKVMIFQKKYRKSVLDKFHFQTNQHKIAIVNNYTYLSVNFSSNGNSVRDCKLNLKDKVRRAFFATRHFLDFTKIPLAVTNKLFDSLFIPILLYSSEIWGIYEKDDFNTWEKDIIEKTHIFLCKQSLGVNKHGPNVVARNELGRRSLKLATDANILKFYIHLQAQPNNNNNARQCLQLSMQWTCLRKLNLGCR